MAFVLAMIGNPARATSESWTNSGSGSWGTTTNWSANIAPGSTTVTNNSDIATFNAATAGSIITIDAGRNIGGITFDTLAGLYTIGGLGANGGNLLTLTSGGTVQIASTFAGTSTTETIDAPLLLEGSYTFANNSSTGNALNIEGNITNGATSILALSAANATVNTISGIISDGVGAQSITKAGTGTWVLSGANTYTGATRINTGVLEITGSLNNTTPSQLVFGGNSGAGTALFSEAAGSAQAMGKLTVSALAEATVQSTYGGSGNTSLSFASYARAGAGTVNFVSSGGVNGSTNKIVLGGAATGFQSNGVFFNGGDYAWYDAGGYVRGINYGTDAGSESITSSQATFTAGKQYEQVSGNGAITAQTTQAITTLNLANSNNFTLADGATLTVNGILKSGGTAGGTIGGGSGIQTTAGGEMVIRTDTADDTLNISTPILANGASSLTKSGAGTLTLSGNNTYTGTTTVLNGTLNLTGNNTGASSGLTVYSGATAHLSGNNTYTAGTFTAGNGGTLIMSGDNTGTSGTFAISAVSNGTLDINSAKALGNNTLTLTSAILDNTSGDDVTVSTNNSLAMGNITFTGTNNLNLGTGNVTIGATHIGVNVLAKTLTIGGNFVDTSASTFLTKSGAGTLALTGNILYKGGTGIGTNNGVYAGTLILSGDNTAATGGVGMFNGVLDLNSDTALGGNLSIQNALATIDNTSGAPITLINNPTQTWLTGFTFGGTYDLNMGTGAVTLANHTANIITTAGTLTEGGAISGSGGVINKSGAGTLILSGTNTYTGTTTVSGGVLLADNATSSTGTGAVVVNGTGILGGNGVIATSGITAARAIAVNFASGSTLSPSNGSGISHLTLSLNAGTTVNLAAGTHFVFDLGAVGTSDEVTVTGGTLTLGGQQFSDFTFNTESGFGSAGTYTLMDAAAGITGSLSSTGSLSGIIDGMTGTLSISGDELVLDVAAVPEPSTYALMLAGLVVVAGCRRLAKSRLA